MGERPNSPTPCGATCLPNHPQRQAVDYQRLVATDGTSGSSEVAKRCTLSTFLLRLPGQRPPAHTGIDKPQDRENTSETLGGSCHSNGAAVEFTVGSSADIVAVSSSWGRAVRALRNPETSCGALLIFFSWDRKVLADRAGLYHLPQPAGKISSQRPVKPRCEMGKKLE